MTPRAWFGTTVPASRVAAFSTDCRGQVMSDDEVISADMSEAAKCRVRNRAARKAREAAAMKEVMLEEQIQDLKQTCSSFFLPLALGLLFVWWGFYRPA